MYVCLCRKVTDRCIKRSVDEEGSTRLRDLRQSLGVAEQCGRCAQCANKLLNQHLEARSCESR